MNLKCPTFSCFANLKILKFAALLVLRGGKNPRDFQHVCALDLKILKFAALLVLRGGKNPRDFQHVCALDLKIQHSVLHEYNSS